MKLNWGVWLYGLFGGFIGGGAGAVTTAFAAMGIDHEHFNLNAGHGLTHTLELSGTVFLLNGLITAFAYLSKSPLPPPEAPSK